MSGISLEKNKELDSKVESTGRKNEVNGVCREKSKESDSKIEATGREK